nr:site-specific integrase [Candidatus Hydrogenedentota bacterium]
MSAIEILLFVNYLKTERGFSKHTLRAYMNDLDQFCDFVDRGAAAFAHPFGEPRPKASLEALHRATRNEVRAFLAHVQTTGGTPRTAARKLASLRAAYKFLVRRGMLEDNPAQEVKSPKLSRELPDVLSVPEVTQLLEAPDTAAPLGARDRALMETLYSSGMRAAECAGLKVSDLDLGRGVARVLGKRRKERIAQLG